MNALGRCAAVVAALGATASPAAAYVRKRSDAGTPIAWRTPQITLVVARPSAFWTTAETFLGTVVRASATWSHEAIPCGDVELRVAPALVDESVVRNDGTNTVMVAENGWSHQTDAIALTTVFHRNLPGQPEDGEILDADIEINANYTWADISDDATTVRGEPYDLRNALTHELGHLLGLWHNCHGDDEQALPDDQGRPSPSCANLTGDLMLATMFWRIEPLATDKRSLSDDELRAVCDIYPYTYQLVGAGCSLAPSPAGQAPRRRGVAALGVLTTAFVLHRRRRG